MSTKQTTQIPTDYGQARVLERPDGHYWQDKLTSKYFGPFPTLLDAVQDMQDKIDSDLDHEEGESLEEAEAEIGVANWIDPETGELAEDSLTRLSDN